MDSLNLKNRTVVITGCAGGLGLAFAEALASVDCNIAALDIVTEPPTALCQLRSAHGVKVEYYKCDISSRSQVSEVIERVVADFISINLVINAAGIVQDEPFLWTSDHNIEKTFAVNFTGSFLVSQACAKQMVKQYQGVHGEKRAERTEAAIIFIASIATHIASSAQRISCYTASKAAVRGLVAPLAAELAPYGIRVNSLSPGYTMTAMMQSLQKEQPDLVGQFEKETMFGRIGLPDELTGATLWMCSDRLSGWYTGQDMLVDGGASSWKHPAAL
ncbi:hypothetical protein LTR70_010087 [Exophiala xenobiotica]|uniref:Ketoreductase domain-containing protein n=1 Tax=Lithohypha guttulata TaxID=1690604 RepID=A0ABR0JVJ3_9EURO|nr:hypothetical protein LTR24_010045 [Lithohypha guttulata]KAK5309677.1 hypothetical protein LTR70_010087 [Exophiala xenobiotica]